MPNDLTLDETAEVLRTSADTVKRLLKRGELKGYRLGRFPRILADSIEAYRRRHAITPAGNESEPTPPKKKRGGGQAYQSAMDTIEKLGII